MIWKSNGWSLKAFLVLLMAAALQMIPGSLLPELWRLLLCSTCWLTQLFLDNGLTTKVCHSSSSPPPAGEGTPFYGLHGDVHAAGQRTINTVTRKGTNSTYFANFQFLLSFLVSKPKIYFCRRTVLFRSISDQFSEEIVIKSAQEKRFC